ncbi:MAG: short-chain dehydrogenase [Chloroflexi bacterium RBG_16_57_8]|nr:MAG: short-chain dehydrogenase [Chloroflexi bacterium RBG_16_57_8]
MDRVKGKVAVVTGGASGIGEATAKLLAREGASAAIVDIDDVNGQRVAGEIQNAGGVAAFWHMDVTREEEVRQAFAGIYDKFRQLHILVNNAGIAGPRKPVHETPVEEWDRVMNVNLRGAFFCTKHAVPYILKTGTGSVVNVASVYGILGCDTPSYDTSKGAMRSMTKSDALIYAKSNIRFNSIHPGNILTPLFRKLAAVIDPVGVDNAIRKLSVSNPLGRMGTPEEIANCILFLASDESSYVTGIELLADGGMVNLPFPVY